MVLGFQDNPELGYRGDHLLADSLEIFRPPSLPIFIEKPPFVRG